MAIYSLLLSVALPLSGALAHNNGLALTPQMGWNTWNHFGCDISEDTILGAAKAFISYGLPDYGYECKSKTPSPIVSLSHPRTKDILMDDCECRWS